MSAIITSVSNPVWANEEHTLIDCVITLDIFGNEPISFTASPDDIEEHGRNLFKKLSSGIYGNISEYVAPVVSAENSQPVADYVPPADVTGEEALTQVRTERDRKLSTEVDPIVSNPLRWADLTAAQQQAWSDYRRALLDITTTYPTPSFVWNENKQGYDEVGIVWPVKP